MTKKERKKLHKEIKQLCEKQYRKGVQQGVSFSIRGLMNEDEASKFRHEYGGADKGYVRCVNPVTKQADYKERLSMEWFGNRQESPLRLLLNEFER
jgi:hypothetical protein